MNLPYEMHACCFHRGGWVAYRQEAMSHVVEHHCDQHTHEKVGA